MTDHKFIETVKKVSKIEMMNYNYLLCPHYAAQSGGWKKYLHLCY